MNDILSKIPKPILVVAVLVIAVALFIVNDPLKDECEVQARNFERNMRGILTATKKNKKIQFALLGPMKENCRDGNSIGSCAEYFEALRKMANEMRSFKDKCQIKYAEENEAFLIHLSQALQTMALVAWGDKPPTGVAERAGWLIESQLRTFCTLKKSYLVLAGEENYRALRNRIYLEYPDVWPTSLVPNETTDVDNRKPENRPRALKTASNQNGSLDQKQIFERSLFSIRCDLYL